MTPSTARTTRTLLGLALAATPLAAATTASATDASDLAEVRAATARYHDVDRAIADGYRLASGCVPNMGYHYQRGIAATGDDLAPTSPEILVYAPRPNGGLRLVAVEYATWDADATLLGRAFDAPHGDGPPFHTLHAWVWQGNPNGTFAPLNPNVRC
ncbi:MAG: hypothetical protein LPK38_08085 [Actinomycetes bacterium]|nr:hypothetical protein [Actinomycetes bacterium]MDX5381232.1 hypothetical protein [Actinomycetes bacterium]MDX5400542.1 hypothetical protein [Actinomycetes bacterium]MDX5451002.1 hypothetical protein [Actinomycetes bacterium]